MWLKQAITRNITLRIDEIRGSIGNFIRHNGNTDHEKKQLHEKSETLIKHKLDALAFSVS